MPGHPAVSSSEENILHYPGVGGSYNVLIHEFAHAIHLFGLNTTDPTFDNRLKAAYDAAMAQRIVARHCMLLQTGENTGQKAHKGGFTPGKVEAALTIHGNTRDVLKAYDPGLAALLAEIYDDTEWRYTPPAVRLHLPHLQGFNPQDSPATVSRVGRVGRIVSTIPRPQQRWSEVTGWTLRPYDPRLIPILNESRTPGSPTGIGFINVTQADVLLYNVRYDGREGYRARLLLRAPFV